MVLQFTKEQSTLKTVCPGTTLQQQSNLQQAEGLRRAVVQLRPNDKTGSSSVAIIAACQRWAMLRVSAPKSRLQDVEAELAFHALRLKVHRLLESRLWLEARTGDLCTTAAVLSTQSNHQAQVTTIGETGVVQTDQPTWYWACSICLTWSSSAF